LEEYLEENKKVYDDITDNSENAIDELHKIGDCLRKHVQDSNPSLLFDIQKFHPKAWSLWAEYKNKFIKCSVVRNIQQGIKDGHFRADINPEIFRSEEHTSELQSHLNLVC